MVQAKLLRTETRQQSPREEEVAELALAIAAVLAGALPLPAGITPLAAVSALLGVLPGAPEPSVRDAAARLVVDDQEPLPTATGALRRAHIDNLIYRAHYAINAMKRLGQSVAAGEDLRGALRKEAPNFEAHREANRTRLTGARLNDAAAERWGPVLNWNHTGKTHTHRPSHVAADGKNYRVDSPPISTEGMLPGMAMHCDCVPGPPKPNAPTLI